jgi:hypothetical protein
MKPGTTVTLKKLREQLKASEEKTNVLETQMAQLELEQNNLKLGIVNLEYGLSIGSVVRNSEGKLFRVIFIDVVRATPWVTANPKRRDGTWGATKKHLYRDWEVVNA